MKYLADLHIHSHFSRATSKASNLHGLACWAAVKGIQVVGTGDFTHPGWYAQFSEHLEEAEPGFFRLKTSTREVARAVLPPGISVDPSGVRFVLTAEVSSIYKKDNAVRKIHNILFAPDLESVRNINAKLAAIGNIESDGRPILGLDARDLLEIMLEKAPQGFLVPAHIWTPWFSLFGSKSGFDALEECFTDLSGHVFALETGLSSDPEMNRLISALDRYTLISNSDCHSPSKLGREANLFDTGFDYYSLKEAIRRPVDADGRQVFEATVEFYPEEGKYHCDGHRKCGVCFEPAETLQHNTLCPVCEKPLTVGVLHRVMQLADRDKPVFPAGSPAVHSLIPLNEVLSELLGTGPNTKKVAQAYSRLIQTFGSEFDLLLHVPIDEIAHKASVLLGEAIQRIRQNQVIRQAGYDGEFGVIKVFSEGELASLRGQLNLFGIRPKKVQPAKRRVTSALPENEDNGRETATKAKELNTRQLKAVTCKARHQVVHAGPGAGKTHTLVNRVIQVARLASPATVITFTNKAADEISARLHAELGETDSVMVATFHGYCLHWLRQKDTRLTVAGREDRKLLLQQLFPDATTSQVHCYDERISLFLRWPPASPAEPEVRTYLHSLDMRNLIDLEAIIPCALALLKKDDLFSKKMQSRTGQLFVDEFQDVSPLQYELVGQLAKHSPVFAIGDPDQSVYGFRGSDPLLFRELEQSLGAELHTLTANYRSGEKILRAAENLINHNHPAAPKPPMSAKSGISGRLYLQKCLTPRHEAVFVAQQIEQAVGGTSHRAIERIQTTDNQFAVSLADISVLFRTSRQAQTVASELSQKGIPFQLLDIESFYSKEPCRPLYYWVLLLGGCADIGEQLYLFSLEKGVGNKTVHQVAEQITHGQTDQETGSLLLDFAPRELTSATAARRLRTFQDFCHLIKTTAADQGLSAALDTLSDHYSLDKTLPELIRFRDMAASQSTSIEGFAAYLKRFSDSVVYDDTIEAVTLSTLHAAKGLEFKVVFIVGLEEGLLPLGPRQSADEQTLRTHVEEERRLLYVGMTRAIETLCLSWCAKRSANGQPGDGYRAASSFLQEIPSTLFSAIPGQENGGRSTKSNRQQLRLF